MVQDLRLLARVLSGRTPATKRGDSGCARAAIESRERDARRLQRAQAA